MTHIKVSSIGKLVLIAFAIGVVGSAAAEKPSSAGGDKYEKYSKGENKQQKHSKSGDKHKEHSKKEQYNDHDDRKGYYDNRDYDDRDRSYYSGGKFFSDRHRTALRGYYDNYTRSGRCPPGLAKKNNGCIPPGQAKKWAIGQPLPGDMAYSDLSADLARILGLPPQGYRYVQSGSDILMINGARIVMDAINNWGR